MKGSLRHVDFCLEDVGELISHGELLCLTMSAEWGWGLTLTLRLGRLDQLEGGNVSVIPLRHHVVVALTMGVVLASRGETPERHLVHRPAVRAGVRAARGRMPCRDHVWILCSGLSSVNRPAPGASGLIDPR
jgi:hypothetical protein